MLSKGFRVIWSDITFNSIGWQETGFLKYFIFSITHLILQIK